MMLKINSTGAPACGHACGRAKSTFFGNRLVVCQIIGKNGADHKNDVDAGEQTDPSETRVSASSSCILTQRKPWGSKCDMYYYYNYYFEINKIKKRTMIWVTSWWYTVTSWTMYDFYRETQLVVLLWSKIASMAILITNLRKNSHSWQRHVNKNLDAAPTLDLI